MQNERESGDLIKGRDLLAQAAATYERSLTPEEYWWLGVGLAASTLAELGGQEYAVGRIQQLMDRLGHKGAHGDWFQRFLEELAALDAEGLLWPRYDRGAGGQMVPTGQAVSAAFDAEAGYFLALAHLAIAAAVHRDDEAAVAPLASAIGELVDGGLRPEHRATVLAALSDRAQEP